MDTVFLKHIAQTINKTELDFITAEFKMEEKTRKILLKEKKKQDSLNDNCEKFLRTLKNSSSINSDKVYKKKGYLFVLATSLKESLKENDLTPTIFNRFLRKKGIEPEIALVTKKFHNKAINQYVSIGSERFYRFKLKDLFGDQLTC